MTDAVCVFCRAHPMDPEWRPFCSKRCKLQDLAKWADGAYTVAGENTSDLDSDREQKSLKPEV